MHDDHEYDRVMMTLKVEESRILVAESRALRARARDAVTVSRRTREHMEALRDRLQQCLRLARR